MMDNNLVFVYLGGFLAVIGVAVVAYGVKSKTNAHVPAAT